MGRMKVYRQRWDLPDAPYVENPFRQYLRPINEPEQWRDPRLAVDHRQEPEEQQAIDIPTRRPVPEMNDTCSP